MDGNNFLFILVLKEGPEQFYFSSFRFKINHRPNVSCVISGRLKVRFRRFFDESCHNLTSKIRILRQLSHQFKLLQQSLRFLILLKNGRCHAYCPIFFLSISYYFMEKINAYDVVRQRNSTLLVVLNIILNGVGRGYLPIFTAKFS